MGYVRTAYLMFSIFSRYFDAVPFLSVEILCFLFNIVYETPKEVVVLNIQSRLWCDTKSDLKEVKETTFRVEIV